MNELQRLENELIIGILSRQRLGDCAGAGLSTDDFTVAFHRRVYKHAEELHNTDRLITLDALRERFSQNGGVTAAEERALAQAAAGMTEYDLGQIARILVDNAERRRVARKLNEASEALVGGGGLDTIIGDVSEYLHRRRLRITGGISLVEAERRADAYRAASVIPTGWPRLDAKFGGGLRGGDLLAVGGWMKSGKTCLLLNLVAQVAEQGYPAAMISLEVGVESCWDQLVARKAMVPHEVIRRGRSSLQIETAREMVRSLPIHFETSLADEREVFQAMERAASNGARVIAVDYYQYIGVEATKSRTRAQGLAEVAVGLKAAARRTGTAVAVAAQLKQPSQEKGSRGIDLGAGIFADSSGLEKSLDIRLHITGPPPLDDEIETRVDLGLMQRNGPGGKIPMLFHKAYRRFTEIEIGG